VSYVDISSHQAAAGTIDLRAYRDDGHTDLMLKATQGAEYDWPDMQSLALAWHNFGPQYRVGYYHWLYATLSAADQHAFFWGQVSPVWRSGDWTMTDFEDTDPARWRSDAATLRVLEEFAGRCWTHGYHDIYSGNWFLADLPRCRTYLKTQNVVMSDYTNDPPANPYDLTYDAHQFTSSAIVAGMPGRVDYNRWLGEHDSGSGTPIVAPVAKPPAQRVRPGMYEVIVNADNGVVRAWGPGYWFAFKGSDGSDLSADSNQVKIALGRELCANPDGLPLPVSQSGMDILKQLSGT
jgi:GH25 family lysozyme M1 (1,4-beta-N-acetylmuramidase)